MAPRADRPRQPNSSGLFLRWHRYLGLSAALFVLLLVITGWLLNHTDALALDERFVKSERLLSLYGIGSPARQLSFFVGGHWISQLDAQLYFDTRRLPGHHEALVGALALSDRIFIATRSRILLLTPDGGLIEAVGPEQGVPGNMTAIAPAPDGRLAVKESHAAYLTDPDLLRWHHTTSSHGMQWVEPIAAPARLQAALLDTWRGSILSWERVILDLHSGRILGRWGPWLIDLAGLLMLLLALSGGYLWWARRPRRRS
jgi:hypothetical protein